MQAVDELLLREADPTGERYSLSKVLHTCQVGAPVRLPAAVRACVKPTPLCTLDQQATTPSPPPRVSLPPLSSLQSSLLPPFPALTALVLQSDLHAIFLHHCLLDAGFARHWPPQLTLQGWLGLMKDIGSTNPVPGTRTRSDNTMHVCEGCQWTSASGWSGSAGGCP